MFDEEIGATSNGDFRWKAGILLSKSRRRPTCFSHWTPHSLSLTLNPNTALRVQSSLVPSNTALRSRVSARSFVQPQPLSSSDGTSQPRTALHLMEDSGCFRYWS